MVAFTVTRKSMFSGVTRTRTFDVPQSAIDAYNSGAMIQRAFPMLTPGEREFILTGVTDEEWDAEFKGATD